MKNIIILDDDEFIVNLCESALRPIGYVVKSFTSAESALSALQTGTTDLLILDLVMPGVSGFEIMRRLRNAKLNIPVVVLTGRKTHSDVLAALDLGAVDYICKPFDRLLFVSKIRAVLESNGKEDLESWLAQAKSNSTAEITQVAQIISVSEMGIKMLAESPIDLRANVKVDSALLTELGVPADQLRVSSCNPAAGNRFEISVGFIGLDENQMRRVRRWVINHGTREKPAE